ncbi:hypothetical protein GCM10009825_29200 [Arthrobacter humicola]|uniref:Anti-sigma factor n=1 Tax=Arthrobacter humicola TaxID=409291 RepID=A0ABP5L2V9_9MICC
MGLLKRLLGGSGCRFSGRTGRSRIGATRKLSAGHHDHMETCAECRARQQRERQYLERLRGAAVPEASEDLTARLLARTEQLAAERAAAEGTDSARADTAPADTARAGTAPAGSARADTEGAESAWADTAPGGTHRAPERLPAEDFTTDRPGTDRPLGGWAAEAAHPQGGRRRGPRLPALAAGGAVAALALMAGTAYFMGGDATVLADGAETSKLSHPDTAGQLATGEPLTTGNLSDVDGSSAGGTGTAGVPGDAGSGPWVGLGPGGEPDFTPAGALSAGQLAALRAQGWTCPELRDLGFHLMWARAGVMSGDAVLELRLTDGRHFATVLEQHDSAPRVPGTPAAQARADASPINVLTGHTAMTDGFTVAKAGTAAAPESGPDARPGAGPGDNALWVNPGPPYRAIYQTAAATYTYVSDLPADQAGDGAAALTRVSSPASAPASRDGIPERIERGLSRILEHLAP